MWWRPGVYVTRLFLHRAVTDGRTDGQTDRIPIANTRSQQYLPVQLSRLKTYMFFLVSTNTQQWGFIYWVVSHIVCILFRIFILRSPTRAFATCSINHLLMWLLTSSCQWRRGRGREQLPHPLNFCLSEYFRLVLKFSSKNNLRQETPILALCVGNRGTARMPSLAQG